MARVRLVPVVLLFLVVVSFTAAKRLRSAQKILFQTSANNGADGCPAGYDCVEESVSKTRAECDPKAEDLANPAIVGECAKPKHCCPPIATGETANPTISEGALEKLRKIGLKQGFSAFVPAEFISAEHAMCKSKDLEELADGMGGANWDTNGNAASINTIKKAIQFVVGKKLNKANKKMLLGLVKVGTTVTMMATGTSAGTIVPVAGNVVGAGLGFLSASAILNPATTASVKVKDSFRNLMKRWNGEQGTHRTTAATVLFDAAHDDSQAALQVKALKALEFIFGKSAGVYDNMMTLTNKETPLKKWNGNTVDRNTVDLDNFNAEWITYIASRMKST